MFNIKSKSVAKLKLAFGGFTKYEIDKSLNVADIKEEDLKSGYVDNDEAGGEWYKWVNAKYKIVDNPK